MLKTGLHGLMRSMVFFSSIICLLISVSAGYGQQAKRVLFIGLTGVVNPVSAEFIHKGLQKAAETEAEAVIIALDTPGGLDASMRSIVKAITASPVPVVTYVYPGGARAASAGVFIMMASHIAAMAPGTNIGAAHPVSIGDKMDKTREEKAANDAAAYIRSLAEKNGRNASWAEDAVRKSVSATESEALKQGVIDIVSGDRRSLLKDIDGRKVVTSTGGRTLQTASAEIVEYEMGFRHRVLDLISDPSIAYMLLMLGFYGIFFELTNPGAMFPGIAGALFLILGLYSLQTLPVNYAGLLLILLALVLFILEIKIVSHGLLTIGGVISMIIGSLMLFDSPDPFFRLSMYVILPTALVTALFFTLTLRLGYRAFRLKPMTGSEGLVGGEGRAETGIDGTGGTVLIHGERWSAVSDEPIGRGDPVIVLTVAGLKIKVKKKEVE